MKLGCPISRQLLACPEAIFLRSAEGAVSYAEADRLIEGYALQIRSAGLGSGSTLGICSRNSLEYCYLIFAAARVGVSLAHLNPQLTATERGRLAEIARVEALVGEGAPGVRSLKLALQPAEAGVSTPAPEEPPLAIVFTSGSSGEPKGAELAVAALEYAAQTSNERSGFSNTDCWLLSLPLLHVGGLGILYRAALAGASVWLSDRGNAESIRSALRAAPTISHLSLVPTVLGDLVELGEERLDRLKFILLGGAPVPSRLAELCRTRKLPVFTSFGMTESCSHLTLGPLREDARCCGAPLRGVELLIREGEIYLRTPALFRGYRTGAEFLPATEAFGTRDLGRVQNGELFWLGRKDRMFTSGGENVYPEEIERAALDFPGVAEAIVGSTPDERWGARPVLWVRGLGDLKLTALRDWLCSCLAPYKCPDRIFVLDRFPRTAAGKPDLQSLGQALRAEAP